MSLARHVNCASGCWAWIGYCCWRQPQALPCPHLLELPAEQLENKLAVAAVVGAVSLMVFFATTPFRQAFFNKNHDES